MTRKWWTLTAVSVATFMLLLDITVVNVALPSIRDDLGASFTDLQWVIDAYALTLAALVLTAGSLADRLRAKAGVRRRLGDLLAPRRCCARSRPTRRSSTSPARSRGSAARSMFAVSLALIAQEFAPGRERGTAMGVYGATIGVAVAIGPLVGGALTDALGWRSIFYLNVPIGLAAIAITWLRVRESRDPHATRDRLARASRRSAPRCSLLVLALVRGNDEGWGSALILALFAGAAALLVAFVAVERRVREPMLPLGLFARPGVHRRPARGVRGVGLDLRPVPVPHAVPAELPRPDRRSRPALRYLPITVASFVGAADRRRAARARPGPR